MARSCFRYNCTKPRDALRGELVVPVGDDKDGESGKNK